MGIVLTKLFNQKNNQRILMVGLDGAGKTTLLYKLKLGEVQQTIPTIGFNVEEVQYKKIRFTVWDIGGQDRIRPLWVHYFNGVNALVYVFDINDIHRKHEMMEELQKLLMTDQLNSVPVLIYANKCDMRSYSREQIKSNDIYNEVNRFIKHHNFIIQDCSAITGDGLYEGLEWLNKQLK